MPLAATWYDLVIGVCIHWEMLPPPISSPCPFPNVYVGLICDPLGEMLGAAISRVLGGPPPAAPVTINGMPVAITGQSATILPILPLNPFHRVPVPPGISWTAPTLGCPSGDADLIFGSKTVRFRGAQAVRLGDVALNDSDPVPLPFSAVLAIPKGVPVLVGGPQALDGSAALWGIVPGLGVSALGAAGKRISRFVRSTRAFRRASAAARRVGRRIVRTASQRTRLISSRARDALQRVRCRLGFEPVDLVTGAVLQSDCDAALPGPLPLVLERNYSSSLGWRNSPVGHGWSHSLDEAVFFELGQLVYRTSDGRELEYSMLGLHSDVFQPGDELFDPENEWTIRCTDPFRFDVRTKDGIVRHFARLDPSSWKAPLDCIRSRDGQEIRLVYDPATRRPRMVLDSVGRRVLLEHDADGRLVRVLLPHPTIEHAHVEHRRFEYSTHGDLITVYDAFGRAERFEYSNHLLVRRTDRNGAVWCWKYDGVSSTASCIRTWGPGGIQHGRLTYDKPNGTTTVKDSSGRWKRYHYTPDYRVTKIVDMYLGEEHIAYDEHARVISQTDLAGRTTRYVYDARSNVTRVELPGGAVIEAEYDEHDQLTHLRDALGGSWRYRYDAEGHRTESTNAAGETTRYEWAHALLRAVVAPGGARSEIEYDSDKNVDLVRTADGVEHRSWYDRLGRVVRRRHPKELRLPVGGKLPNAERRWYDRVGRLAQIESYDGTFIHLDHDPEGNLVRHRSMHHDLRFTWRADSVLLSRQEWRPVKDECLSRVELGHDGDGRLVEVKNERGERYRFSHDCRGDLMWEVGWDDGLRRYRRDLKTGVLLEIMEPSCKKDRLCLFTGVPEIVADLSGRTTQLDWDDAGRVRRIIHSDGTATAYDYDAAGSLLEATNETGTLSFERDPLGRVLSERFEPRGRDEHTVSSSYDLAGDRIAVRSSLGFEQHITRGVMGDVVALAAGPARTHDPWTVAFERDRTGAETARHFAKGATSVRWERDLLGRPLTRRTDSTSRILEQSRWKWGTIDHPDLLQLFAPSADAPGTVYLYDARHRLAATRRADSPGERDWHLLDDAGNVYRTAEKNDRTYGPGGRLDQADGTSYQHDRDGYLVQKTAPNGRTWRYGWNGHGQLKTVALPDGHTVEMRYDPLGRRVEKFLKDPAGHSVRNTRFVWDGHLPLHELSDEEEPTAWIFEPEAFAPLAKLQGKHSYGIVPDHIGSPHALYDEAGQLAWKAQLDVWGVAKTDVAATRQPWRFPGQYEDEEIGLFYNRFRYYDPDAGRYISQDPIRIGGGLNVYAYVYDPVRYDDPLGLACRRPGGHQAGDVAPHGVLSPGANRAPGHANISADGRVQSHHPIQDDWARHAVGDAYDRDEAPAVLLRSSGGAEHAQISAMQQARRRAMREAGVDPYSTTTRQEFDAAADQMRRAGVPEPTVRRSLRDAYVYFDSIGAFQ